MATITASNGAFTAAEIKLLKDVGLDMKRRVHVPGERLEAVRSTFSIVNSGKMMGGDTNALLALCGICGKMYKGVDFPLHTRICVSEYKRTRKLPKHITDAQNIMKECTHCGANFEMIDHASHERMCRSQNFARSCACGELVSNFEMPEHIKSCPTTNRVLKRCEHCLKDFIVTNILAHSKNCKEDKQNLLKLTMLECDHCGNKFSQIDFPSHLDSCRARSESSKSSGKRARRSSSKTRGGRSNPKDRERERKAAAYAAKSEALRKAAVGEEPPLKRSRTSGSAQNLNKPKSEGSSRADRRSPKRESKKISWKSTAGASSSGSTAPKGTMMPPPKSDTSKFTPAPSRAVGTASASSSSSSFQKRPPVARRPPPAGVSSSSSSGVAPPHQRPPVARRPNPTPSGVSPAGVPLSRQRIPVARRPTPTPVGVSPAGGLPSRQRPPMSSSAIPAGISAAGGGPPPRQRPPMSSSSAIPAGIGGHQKPVARRPPPGTGTATRRPVPSVMVRRLPDAASSSQQPPRQQPPPSQAMPIVKRDPDVRPIRQDEQATGEALLELERAMKARGLM